MAALRIVGLGDSTTAGTPAFLSPLEVPPSGRGNPESQYAHWMMRARPDWEVLNRGINGQRSDEILARFSRDVVKERANYVIVLAGVNDIYQRRPPEHLRENLDAMYRLALDARIVPVTATVAAVRPPSANARRPPQRRSTLYRPRDPRGQRVDRGQRTDARPSVLRHERRGGRPRGLRPPPELAGRPAPGRGRIPTHGRGPCAYD